MIKFSKWGERRRYKYKRDGKCSRCTNERLPGQRYCREHRNEYRRRFDKKHSDLSPAARKRANCRAYANTYLRRGKITKQPCGVCGAKRHIEMHHEDYDQPLDIIWLCRKHHKEFHTLKKRQKDQ